MWVLTSDYEMMTGCLKLVAWCHKMVTWNQMRLYKLKKVLWTPNSVQNIGVIDNFQQKLVPFFGDVLLHSRLMDCHQVKAKRAGHIVTVTATYLNFIPVAHEISSVEAFKGGKFEEESCINISFLQLPSHITSYIIMILYDPPPHCQDSSQV